MAAEKAMGLVVRATDYSDTSRIVTLWTRELGKVRALAKGGRRLKSNFDSALDLLTVCSIVLLRKSSGGLDLLTEAQVVERFPQLRKDLPALYAAYYLAELLGDWTEDYDPHPRLFDEALETLRTLGTGIRNQESGMRDHGSPSAVPTGLRLLRFEMVLLKELGYAPILDVCAGCRRPLPQSVQETRATLLFSSAAGGVVCGACRTSHRGRVSLAAPTWEALKLLGQDDAWRTIEPAERAALRQLFNEYISHLLGRRPRTMPYLGS
jgi:DNA repair protein RecO (recombination protein O)